MRLNRKKFLSLMAATLVLPLAGCAKTYRWRQKLTVTVATPTGDRSGSAVTEVRAKLTNSIGAGWGASVNRKGEAVVVDLGNGKYLFGLQGELTNYLAQTAFKDSLPSDTVENIWAKLEQMQGSRVELSPSLYPMLVTFGDLTDPKSVKGVKPSDLAASFGPGYALKSITLEITDEPVTEGVVEKLLPWIGNPAVMENPNWGQIPESARRLLGGFLSNYRAAQDRYLKVHSR